MNKKAIAIDVIKHPIIKKLLEMNIASSSVVNRLIVEELLNEADLPMAQALRRYLKDPENEMALKDAEKIDIFYYQNPEKYNELSSEEKKLLDMVHQRFNADRFRQPEFDDDDDEDTEVQEFSEDEMIRTLDIFLRDRLQANANIKNNTVNYVKYFFGNDHRFLQTFASNQKITPETQEKIKAAFKILKQDGAFGEPTSNSEPELELPDISQVPEEYKQPFVDAVAVIEKAYKKYVPGDDDQKFQYLSTMDFAYEDILEINDKLIALEFNSGNPLWSTYSALFTAFMEFRAAAEAKSKELSTDEEKSIPNSIVTIESLKKLKGPLTKAKQLADKIDIQPSTPEEPASEEPPEEDSLAQRPGETKLAWVKRIRQKSKEDAVKVAKADTSDGGREITPDEKEIIDSEPEAEDAPSVISNPTAENLETVANQIDTGTPEGNLETSAAIVNSEIENSNMPDEEKEEKKKQLEQSKEELAAKLNNESPTMVSREDVLGYYGDLQDSMFNFLENFLEAKTLREQVALYSSLTAQISAFEQNMNKADEASRTGDAKRDDVFEVEVDDPDPSFQAYQKRIKERKQEILKLLKNMATSAAKLQTGDTKILTQWNKTLIKQNADLLQVAIAAVYNATKGLAGIIPENILRERDVSAYQQRANIIRGVVKEMRPMITAINKQVSDYKKEQGKIINASDLLLKVGQLKAKTSELSAYYDLSKSNFTKSRISYKELKGLLRTVVQELVGIMKELDDPDEKTDTDALSEKLKEVSEYIEEHIGSASLIGSPGLEIIDDEDDDEEDEREPEDDFELTPDMEVTPEKMEKFVFKFEQKYAQPVLRLRELLERMQNLKTAEELQDFISDEVYYGYMEEFRELNEQMSPMEFRDKAIEQLSKTIAQYDAVVQKRQLNADLIKNFQKSLEQLQIIGVAYRRDNPKDFELTPEMIRNIVAPLVQDMEWDDDDIEDSEDLQAAIENEELFSFEDAEEEFQKQTGDEDAKVTPKIRKRIEDEVFKRLKRKFTKDLDPDPVLSREEIKAIIDSQEFAKVQKTVDELYEWLSDQPLPTKKDEDGRDIIDFSKFFNLQEASDSEDTMIIGPDAQRKVKQLSLKEIINDIQALFKSLQSEKTTIPPEGAERMLRNIDGIRADIVEIINWDIEDPEENVIDPFKSIESNVQDIEDMQDDFEVEDDHFEPDEPEDVPEKTLEAVRAFLRTVPNSNEAEFTVVSGFKESWENLKSYLPDSKVIEIEDDVVIFKEPFLTHKKALLQRISFQKTQKTPEAEKANLLQYRFLFRYPETSRMKTLILTVNTDNKEQQGGTSTSPTSGVQSTNEEAYQDVLDSLRKNIKLPPEGLMQKIGSFFTKKDTLEERLIQKLEPLIEQTLKRKQNG